MTTVVLVHGAWHGPWCWDWVRLGLDKLGVPTVAPELPLTTLADDAAALQDVLDRVDDEVVVVGHSYGGSVVTLGASGAERVGHLVYLCAFMLDAGLPVQQDGQPMFADAVRVEDGWTTIDPAQAGDAFYGDVPPELAATAVERLRPFAAFAEVSTSAPPAWSEFPSTYVVCTLDRAIHPDDQQVMARNARQVVEWPTSHSPFLSRPSLVVDLVAGLTGQHTTSGQPKR